MVVDNRNYKILDDLKRLFKERYNPIVLRKIILRKDNYNNAVYIETKFSKPHLDVTIELNGDEYTASYSNNNYSEHRIKPKTSPEEIAEGVFNLVVQLLEKGAVQIDKTSGDIVYSTETRVGTIDRTTDVKKINPFVRKKKLVIKYPAAISSSPDARNLE